MKKFFALVLIAVVGLYAANLTVKNTDNRLLNGRYADIHQIQLYNSTEAAVDTFASTVVRVFGPYTLEPDPEKPFPTGFSFYVRSITGTTPGFSIDYCLTPTDAYDDTISTSASWVSIDSVVTSGSGFDTYVSLASKAGRYIWFRFNNYDNAAAQIPKPVYVTFKRGGTYNNK